jgi:hypothetical protein
MNRSKAATDVQQYGSIIKDVSKVKRCSGVIILISDIVKTAFQSMKSHYNIKNKK